LLAKIKAVLERESGSMSERLQATPIVYAYFPHSKPIPSTDSAVTVDINISLKNPIFFCAWILLQNLGFIILLLSAFQHVHGENMVNCPECGKPLVKQNTGNKYNCENESCNVIYVKYPFNIAIRTVVHSSLRKR
jgi:hypothetical protein